MGVDKKKSVKDEKMETPKEYGRDFQDFSDKRDELCLKHKKQVHCRKEPASLQSQGPTKTVGNSE